MFAAIAQSAIKIGGKLIGKVKENRLRKVEKRAAALAEAEKKQRTFLQFAEQVTGAPSNQAISASGDAVAGVKKYFNPDQPMKMNFASSSLNTEEKEVPNNLYPDGGNKQVMYIVGGVVVLGVLYLALKK